jgi:hypothetical protein
LPGDQSAEKGTGEKALWLLLVVGLVLAFLLLTRFTIDFYLEMPLWLAVPFSLLVVAAVLMAALHLGTWGRTGAVVDPAKPSRALLLATIPLGFLASTLDCSGLAPNGCTPLCTLIKLGLIPALALLCALYFFRPFIGLPILIGLLSFVTLVPHCVCTNVGNGWWIARLGASPMCYVWGFSVSLIALGAIRSGRHAALSLLVNAAILGGAMAFFISHHYFHFPW